MSDEKPVSGNEEPDRDVDSKPVTEQAPDRRRLFRRLVALAGLGITGVLLSQEKTGLLPPVEACSGSTCFNDSGSGIAVEGSSSSGIGVYGTSTSNNGVYGTSSSAQGVYGSSSTSYGVYGTSTSYIGVYGYSSSYIGGSFSGPTAAIYADGNVGIGTLSPARLVHLQGDNAVFRMDRDVDSAAFILVRTAVGDFSTVWKTFVVGASASGVNNGSFFISDLGTGVGGAGTERFVIINTGLVGVGRTPTANNLEVEGTASKTAAGSWLANSDMRIKTEISDIDDALATIRKLHPVRFRYTDSYRVKHPSIKNHSYYNFIAQEYREVFPDSVQDDGEGLLQMDSYNTTPYLVRAVQELVERDSELAEQNEALREEIRLLKTRLDTFEQTTKLAAS